MEHIINQEITQNTPTVITLGNFDGIHLGHRALIGITKQYAEKLNIKSVVFSFSPHPMFLFGNRKNLALILSPEEKMQMLEKLGINLYVEYPFTNEFASTDPEKFASEIIFEKMKCRVLVVGYDYHFGRGAKGDYELLKKVGERYGAKVIKVPAVELYGKRVSSTRIREALANHDIKLANELLSEPYFVYGLVRQGRRIGRKMNFPTANIRPDIKKMLPSDGVYATKTVVDDKTYISMTNVGTNPTVNGCERTVETNIFGFSGDIYGKNIKTYFFEYLRGEKKFSGIEELSKRLEKDKSITKEYFSSNEFKKWADRY